MVLAPGGGVVAAPFLPRHPMTPGTRRLSTLALTLPLLTGCASLGLGGGGEGPPLGPDALATLRTAEGEVVGEVNIRDTPRDGALLRVTLYGGVIEPGAHGFHIHETGSCRPDFGAAGGHYAPRGKAHGIFRPQGKHAGDLPNIHLDGEGRSVFETLAHGITTRSDAEGTLFDADGSAFVVHADRDDYRSQPSGAAGDRVACGVVEAR
jgi:Cu-Zn family superoxide dismutase